MIKLVGTLVTGVGVCTFLSGCALFEQDLKALREGQAQQQQQLEEQRQLLEQQSKQLQQLMQQQTGKTSSSPAVTVVKTKEHQVVDSEGRLLLGRVEWTWINTVDQPLKARVDTGAGLSSLNAQKVELFERNGRRWVRFDLPLNEAGDVKTIESPLVRHTRIRQSAAEGMDRRPVVRLKLRLGRLVEETEFTLANRTGMLYPVLLGREFLQDIAIVDVARKFVQPKTEGLAPAQSTSRHP